jgi:hypothetical protein
VVHATKFRLPPRAAKFLAVGHEPAALPRDALPARNWVGLRARLLEGGERAADVALIIAEQAEVRRACLATSA